MHLEYNEPILIIRILYYNIEFEDITFPYC